MLRRSSHDWEAWCRRLHNSVEFECVLCFVVTKFLESSTNTDMCVSHLFLLFRLVECQPGDISSVVIKIGTLMNVN